MITQERKKQLRNGLADAVRSQIEAAKRYVDSDELAYIVQLVQDVETFLLDYENENVFAETDAAHVERDEIMAEYKTRYEKIVQDEDATEEEVEFDLTLLCFEFVTRMEQFGYETETANDIFWESISVYYKFADDEKAVETYDWTEIEKFDPIVKAEQAYIRVENLGYAIVWHFRTEFAAKKVCEIGKKMFPTVNFNWQPNELTGSYQVSAS